MKAKTEGMVSTPSLGPALARISVVIPVYNAASGLTALIHRLKPVLDSLHMGYELILVNDGSADCSWETICELSFQHEWVRGINLMRNYGQHAALLCGIRTARYPVIVTMDDDLQNPPEEIPALLRALEGGYDVVYGTPRAERHGVFRNVASQLTKIGLQRAMGVDTARRVSAFRAFRRDVREAFRHYDGPFVSIDVLLTWGTKRFTSVEVQHDDRALGASNYTLRKLVQHAIDLITGFTTLPLRIATLVGFVFTFFGMTVFGFVLWHYLADRNSVPGFSFLASIISIFSGAQLFALGIVGEYLARMHLRSMGVPSSVIREEVGSQR